MTGCDPLAQKTIGCGHDRCGACCGGSCTGCGGTLLLTQREIDLLLCLAQIPFLPVARQAGSDLPVCLEEEVGGPEASEIIRALQQKGLIRLDYDLPLSNFDYAAYQSCPVKGSMALTAAGQQAAEQLEIQGIEE